jgi:hypothetical protein
LEGISFGLDVCQIDALKYISFPEVESTGYIMNGNAKDEPGIKGSSYVGMTMRVFTAFWLSHLICPQVPI